MIRRLLPSLEVCESRFEPTDTHAIKKVPQSDKAKRQLGRPRSPTETARRNRVVTMVTDSELQELKAIADENKSSMSSVVYKVLARFLSRKYTKT
jgi:hypothetical protein